MKLEQLMEGVPFTLVQGSLDTEIADIIYDSRKAAPGLLFVCIVGTQRDSHAFAADCAAKGISALVIQHDIDLSTLPGVTVVKVESSRYAMALMSANLFGNPARQMTMIGVTGTKGKTTTTHMIKSVLEAAGRKVGMIGTNGIYYMGRHKDTANTTPESYELQKTFREFLDAGCDTALMEVSSQGLMMDRVAGVHYDVGVFTNLSPDHIGPGEHKTFEEYRSWKGQLFKRCDVGVVNIDDENTAALLEGHTCKLVTYGRDEKADYRETGYELLRTHDFLGVAFHVTGKDEMDVKVNMPGEFSVYNALAALAVGKVLGLPDAAIHDGLGKCVVKGRVELVPISKKFTILLDYAHNEVSTESLLTTLRAYKPHRLVVVFGCGGNRSKLRRYGMGEICAKMADFSILTEDNNRFEKVEDILADIRVGMNKGNPEAKFVEIPDRLDALHYAVDHAQEGDLIAVIGKGHETYRDREGVKTPFLERELLEEYAQQKGLDVQRGAADLIGQESAVTGRIQHAGHTHYAVGRELGGQECAVCHHVQGIGNDDDLGIGGVFYHLFGHRFYDTGVDADQIVAAHARFAGHAGGDHHYVRTFGLGIVVGRTGQTGVESADRGGLPDVEGFSFGNAFLDVQDDDFIDKVAAGQYIGARSAYVSCSYYCYFHGKYVLCCLFPFRKTPRGVFAVRLQS